MKILDWVVAPVLAVIVAVFFVLLATALAAFDVKDALKKAGHNLAKSIQKGGDAQKEERDEIQKKPIV